MFWRIRTLQVILIMWRASHTHRRPPQRVLLRCILQISGNGPQGWIAEMIHCAFNPGSTWMYCNHLQDFYRFSLDHLDEENE